MTRLVARTTYQHTGIPAHGHLIVINWHDFIRLLAHGQ